MTTSTTTPTTTTTGSPTMTLVTGQINGKEYRILRSMAMKYFRPDKSRLKKMELYGKVSSDICSLVGTLTNETQQLVEQIWYGNNNNDGNEKNKQQHRQTISNIVSTTSTDDGHDNNNNNSTTRSSSSSSRRRRRKSVAFHIRRGDKSIEIAMTKATSYVAKMVKVIKDDEPFSSIEDCFVATDSYHAIHELESALQAHNVTCHLASFVQPNYKTTRGREDFLGFLAEYLILTKATYFIGTFSSNIGDLVALTRRCEQQRTNKQQQRKQQQQRKGETDDDDDDDEMKNVLTAYNHYSQSYGVDHDEWDMEQFYINNR